MTYSVQFEEAFAQLIPVEGGFTKDPRDPGNWTGGKVGQGVCKGTKYGISAASYPDLDIENLTADIAKHIYWNDYWSRISGDQIPAYLAADVFDMSVNSGVHEAAKLLQLSVGAVPDGNIGPHTLEALQNIGREMLLRNFTTQRILYYSDLTNWHLYRHSWVDRTINALIKALGD